MRTATGFLSLLAIAAVVTTALPAHAQVGELTVKGKRWVNGNEAKVKCIAREGHTLDVSVPGQRTFTFTGQPDCFIRADGDGGMQMVFTGEEEVVLKNGNPKPYRTYTATQTGAAPIEGAVGGRIKCNPTCKTDKGDMIYHRNASGTTILFIGKYKAKFP